MASKKQKVKHLQQHTLNERETIIYRAGEHMGASRGLGAASQDIHKLRAHLYAELELFKTKLMTHASAPMPDGHPLWDAVQKLPDLAESIVPIASNLDKNANLQQRAGSEMMGKLAAQETSAAARWRPPLRAWALLALAMCFATTVSTLAVTLFIRAGW